ncbi:urea transporter [Paraburkholderia phenoliruptrix]|uniref:urea transporter n=1 Tax=Paraburkholderia phenoliruptrix TaxID=252970 RepID=UPI001C4F857F|nr:urea transporter [Paraburkholderia phenoliruptrix]MBW0448200.1 urea transporter [Paraburkholderia phenoliruptrix]MBW9100307.1 urea transporter [Paraburkholderia phenoliruptrix]
MHAAATEAHSAALRTLLRSLGQIVLQANAVTGACVLAGWLVCDPRLACAALLGAVSANVSAVLAGSSDDELHAGLLGFNGALAGLAAFSLSADDTTAAAIAILAATATAWLVEPWSRWLRSHGLGSFSSPCLIVTWLWLPMSASAPPSATVAAAPTLDATGLGSALLAGLAQTGFASSAWAGALVLLGIAATSPRHALYALTGAALASVEQLLLGAPATSFNAGLLGFNGALAALALTECGVAWMLGGVTLAAILQAGTTCVGVPALSAPFVAATWAVQWLKQRTGR